MSHSWKENIFEQNKNIGNVGALTETRGWGRGGGSRKMLV